MAAKRHDHKLCTTREPAGIYKFARCANKACKRELRLAEQYCWPCGEARDLAAAARIDAGADMVRLPSAADLMAAMRPTHTTSSFGV